MPGLSSIQIIAFVIIISWAIFIVVLEKIIPYNKGQKLFRKQFWLDFFWYNALQSVILGVLISWLIEWIDSTSGISRFHLISSWSIWGQVAFFVVTHDLYIYQMHKWMHKNKYLWRLHEAHHSPKEIDWIAGSRSHALEIVINQTIEFLPIVLLGAVPEVAVYKGIISALWGMWIHANIDINSGWLQKIINGPEMHRWHHSTGKGRNRNFATKLAIWDWLFGTAYVPGYKCDEYGLKTFFPDGYFRQIWFAFRPYKRKSKLEAEAE